MRRRPGTTTTVLRCRQAGRHRHAARASLSLWQRLERCASGILRAVTRRLDRAWRLHQRDAAPRRRGVAVFQCPPSATPRRIRSSSNGRWSGCRNSLSGPRRKPAADPPQFVGKRHPSVRCQEDRDREEHWFRPACSHAVAPPRRAVRGNRPQCAFARPSTASFLTSTTL